MHLVTPKTLISTPLLRGAPHFTVWVILSIEASLLGRRRWLKLTSVGLGGFGTDVGSALGRALGGGLGLPVGSVDSPPGRRGKVGPEVAWRTGDEAVLTPQPAITPARMTTRIIRPEAMPFPQSFPSPVDDRSRRTRL